VLRDYIFDVLGLYVTDFTFFFVFSERDYGVCVVLITKRFLCSRKKGEQHTSNSFWLFTRRNKTLHNLLSFIIFSRRHL